MVSKYKIHELQSMFLQYQDVKSNSRAIYKSLLKNFFLWLHRNNLNIYTIRRTNIMEYKKYLQDTYTSVYTVRNNFTAIRLFFTWADNEGILDNPTHGIKQPNYEKKLNKMPLFPTQVIQLLNQIDTNKQVGKRDYAIIYTMITLGLRVEETTNILISDIEEVNDVLLLHIKGKGCEAKTQTMRLESSLYDVIESYLTTRKFSNTGALFVTHEHGKQNKPIGKRSIQKMVKQYMKSIGLTGTKYCTHSLRHTTATLLLLDGKELSEVQSHMRHSNPSTTEVYLRFIREWQRLNSTIGNDIARIITHSHANDQNNQITYANRAKGSLIKIFNEPLNSCTRESSSNMSIINHNTDKTRLSENGKGG